MSGDASAANDEDTPGHAALLDTLRAARAQETSEVFNATVRAVRDELTLAFFDTAEIRVEALRRAGDVDEAETLDELCAAIYGLAHYSMDEVIARASTALPGTFGDSAETAVTETGLTKAQDEEVRRRWAALTSSLAIEGEANAVKQLTLNNSSRQNAITEIAGRVEIGSRELEALKSVAPERRIVSVLLSIPRGTERTAAVDDALTPPAEGEDVEGDEDNEVVFTTAPRLLNVLEAMVKESNATKDGLIEELKELREIVAGKCEF